MRTGTIGCRLSWRCTSIHGSLSRYLFREFWTIEPQHCISESRWPVCVPGNWFWWHVLSFFQETTTLSKSRFVFCNSDRLCCLLNSGVIGSTNYQLIVFHRTLRKSILRVFSYSQTCARYILLGSKIWLSQLMRKIISESQLSSSLVMPHWG